MTAHAQARSQPRGSWGVALLVASEATLLGCVFGSYFYLRLKAVQWPPAGIPEPKALAPLLLTALLVSTSLPVQLAYSAARRGRLRPARRLLLGAFAVQAAYLGLQVHLLLGDLARFAPSEHAYASIYYVLLGAGHAHVAAGLLFEAFLLAKLARGLTRYRLAGLQSAAFYWHFVNVLTIAVVATQLSPRL